MSHHHTTSAEIAHFDNLASDWWDPKGRNRALHLIQKPRLAFIQQHLPPTASTLLDVGCGGGLLCEPLKQNHGLNLTGIDLSENMINLARQHAKESALDIEYDQTSLANIVDQRPGAFHIVTCLELLEHVADPEAMVAQCADACAPGGLCFFSTIHRSFKGFLSTIVAAEYLLQWVERGTHHYHQFIKPSELVSWGERCGLKIMAIQGMTYHLLKQEFILSNDVSSNYILVMHKF